MAWFERSGLNVGDKVNLVGAEFGSPPLREVAFRRFPHSELTCTFPSTFVRARELSVIFVVVVFCFRKLDRHFFLFVYDIKPSFHSNG